MDCFGALELIVERMLHKLLIIKDKVANDS